MPDFMNDITDIHIGNAISAQVLKITTDETTDSVVPKIQVGHQSVAVAPAGATITGNVRVIVERTDGQDVTQEFDGVTFTLTVDENDTDEWMGAPIGGFTDITLVSRVNFYWTQTG